MTDFPPPDGVPARPGRPQPLALTIAGSDPSGGAGIQADLKVFQHFGCFGTSAITLLTVQNTRGVSRVEPMPLDLIDQQIQAVMMDLPPAAVKTGALGSVAVAQQIATTWRELYPEPGPNSPVQKNRSEPMFVVDPVLVSKHGDKLAGPELARAVCEYLVPLATVVTPNRFEARQLSGIEVDSQSTAELAAQRIAAHWPIAVVIKQFEPGADLIWHNGQATVIAEPVLDSKAVHGTGCAFSAALTALLAHRVSLLDAILQAKTWVSRAIGQTQQPGTGAVRPIFFHARL